jgi:hypothetical protein
VSYLLLTEQSIVLYIIVLHVYILSYEKLGISETFLILNFISF